MGCFTPSQAIDASPSGASTPLTPTTQQLNSALLGLKDSLRNSSIVGIAPGRRYTQAVREQALRKMGSNPRVHPASSEGDDDEDPLKELGLPSLLATAHSPALPLAPEPAQRPPGPARRRWTLVNPLFRGPKGGGNAIEPFVVPNPDDADAMWALKRRSVGAYKPHVDRGSRRGSLESLVQRFRRSIELPGFARSTSRKALTASPRASNTNVNVSAPFAADAAEKRNAAGSASSEELRSARTSQPAPPAPLAPPPLLKQHSGNAKHRLSTASEVLTLAAGPGAAAGSGPLMLRSNAAVAAAVAKGQRSGQRAEEISSALVDPLKLSLGMGVEGSAAAAGPGALSAQVRAHVRASMGAEGRGIEAVRRARRATADAEPGPDPDLRHDASKNHIQLHIVPQCPIAL